MTIGTLPSRELWGNAGGQWLAAGLTALGFAAALWLARTVLTRTCRAEGRALLPYFLEAARRTNVLTMLLVGAYLGSLFLKLGRAHEAQFRRVLVLGLILQAGVWLHVAIAKWVNLSLERRAKGDSVRGTGYAAIGFVLQTAGWTLVALAALQNLGINVTALVAGLGVGGIAIALAAQNILGDLFASFSIILDKPFAAGDFIAIDGFMGTVARVGVRTTRLRSLWGEELILSNQDLIRSRVRNYRRMTERRVSFTIGIVYETPPEQVQRLPALIREAIEREPGVRFDRSHFQSYGDSALVFESVYFVLDSDYNRYMDARHAINLRLFERLHAEGIAFAYPTQTVYWTRVRTTGETNDA